MALNLAFLTLEEVLDIHRDQIDRYGGSDGLRDLGLLQSALAMPESGFGDQFFHADIFEMAAAYLFHIVKNHPFIDGNKRVGAMTAFVFLKLNGYSLKASNPAFESMVREVAEGKGDKKQVAAFFKKHAHKN
jgi:death-on-curing protein